ncbi:translation initiation factor IF-2B subunit delta [Candidatus Methanomassiliicoccus intestinalis]|uniref:Ribose 1,5-bisphosphate isomerase n=2 Tax=Candidatus Methanomassiliicoccus intestinalis TaxID=1406512 RepID=A0A8J8TF35_9ARCH|nr:MAG: translation initiation factor IF-2B subunit delta [Candidatus Methanomassiliicoccus intestinalis]
MLFMKLDETAESIRTMNIRGAGLIARSAAEALKELAEEYDGESLIEFTEILNKGRDTLVNSRPTAVSLWNAVQATLKNVKNAEDVTSLKEIVSRDADIFISNSKKAVETIGRIGANRIKDGDVVLTHCNSKAALSVIKTAYEQGKNISVYATESRPWKQGLLTVKDLSDAGIPVTMIVDSAVRWIMKEIDIAVVGADTICSNGALINKIGTSQIGLAAHEARVPMMVCAESYKFSPKTMEGEIVEIEERDTSEVAENLPPNVRIRNPVFDSTPAEYMDCIATEIGLISPYAAYEVIVNKLGHECLFETEG